MRAIFFPLGATQSKKDRLKRRSIWRELILLNIFIVDCINPTITLYEVLNNWANISERLQDPKRKRIRQMSGFT